MRVSEPLPLAVLGVCRVQALPGDSLCTRGRAGRSGMRRWRAGDSGAGGLCLPIMTPPPLPGDRGSQHRLPYRRGSAGARRLWPAAGLSCDVVARRGPNSRSGVSPALQLPRARCGVRSGNAEESRGGGAGLLLHPGAWAPQPVCICSRGLGLRVLGPLTISKPLGRHVCTKLCKTHSHTYVISRGVEKHETHSC